MVQTIVSKNLLPGEKIILFEKPHVLHRVFFSIRAMVDGGLSREMQISFGDPNFLSYYAIDGPEKYFEAKDGSSNEILVGYQEFTPTTTRTLKKIRCKLCGVSAIFVFCDGERITDFTV